MKPNNLLIISLLLNFGLAAAAYSVFKKPSPALAPSTTEVSPAQDSLPPEKTETTTAGSIPAREIQTKTDVNSSSSFHWRQIESRNFKNYIANLRSVNCPEETIRDIIAAEVNAIYGNKMRSLRIGQTETKYWQAGQMWDAKKHFEQQKQVRALEKEKSALLIDLLGVDPNEELNKEQRQWDYWARQYSYLPEDKRERVEEIQANYSALEQEIYRNGMVDDEDNKKLRELYDKRMAELSTFLTPDELKEYDLRASRLGGQLRHELDLLDPTEEEFRRIYDIRKTREHDLAHVYDQDDKEAVKRRNDAVKETDEQIKAFLGEDRFAQLKRANDWNYRELVRLVERQELPRETADKVFDLKTDVEGEAVKIRGDKSLSQEERTLALKRLREEAETGFTESLGDKGWTKYKERHGWWLNNISREEKKK